MTGPTLQTASLCPHCLRRISAARITIDGEVYLEKSCPIHGNLGKTLIWKNAPWPYGVWKRPSANSNAKKLISAAEDGCPYECGICSNHRQVTCSAIVEVTPQCNIRCPVCFSSSETQPRELPKLHQLEQMLMAVVDSGGYCPIQLSGGEPTLREDLPQIVALARKIGFTHVQINTNGIRIAKDASYVQSLKDAGVSDFFLQFDGLTNDVYHLIRGMDLLPLKLRALERCIELKIGVILVPTLIKGINDSQIGAIIQFAKKWMPTIRGVHFQPMAYLGRFPGAPCNQNRMLIPDIVDAIANQTQGELQTGDFIPPG